jgi:hypothetical protein
MSATYFDFIPGFDDSESHLEVQTHDCVAFLRSSGCLTRIDLAAGHVDWLVERSLDENDDTGVPLSQGILFSGKELWVSPDGKVVAELVPGEDGGLVVAARNALDGRPTWKHSIPVIAHATVFFTPFFAADTTRLVVCLFRESRRVAAREGGSKPVPYECQTDAIRLDPLTGQVCWSGSFPGLPIGIMQRESFTGIWSCGTELGRLDFENGSNMVLHQSSSVLGDPVPCGVGLAVSWHSQKEIGVEWFDESGRLIRSSRFSHPKVHSTRLHNTGAGLALQANDAATLWWYGDEDRPLWSVRAKPYIYRVCRSAGTDVFVGTDGMGGRVFGFDPQTGQETLNLKPALGGVGSLSPVDEHSLLVASFRTSKSYSRAPSLLLLSTIDRSHQVAYECELLVGTWKHGAICRVGERNERLAIIDVREQQDKTRRILAPGAVDETEASLPAVGSVYAFKLPGGQYGACRVLRHLPPRRSREAECRGPCAIVAATPWIGGTLPEITEPQLKQIFVLTHHSWGGQQQIRMIPGPLGRGMTLIGNIAPSSEELDVDRIDCSCNWRECTRYWGSQLLLQWKWDHLDRATLLAEEAEQDRQAYPWDN